MTVFTQLDPDRRLIVGVGSALVDILVHTDDAFVHSAGAIKGGMTLVERQQVDQTVALATDTPKLVPGGSACNTMVGIGQLGGRARFVGQCGQGPMGRLLRTDLRRCNVEPALLTAELPTGRVLSMITPDAQRSMMTYLGAAAAIEPEAIVPGHFERAAIVHIEGYLLFNPTLITRVLALAKSAGAIVSLDLASFTVVEEAKTILEDLVRKYVDVLIANEDEARAFTGHADESAALETMAAASHLAVLKLGRRGSRIAMGHHRLDIAPKSGKPAIDTTGAGDLWAAGFLYGLVEKLPLEKCGALGSTCGYEVCRVVGANVPDQRWKNIRKELLD